MSNEEFEKTMLDFKSMKDKMDAFKKSMLIKNRSLHVRMDAILKYMQQFRS